MTPKRLRGFFCDHHRGSTYLTLTHSDHHRGSTYLTLTHSDHHRGSTYLTLTHIDFYRGSTYLTPTPTPQLPLPLGNLRGWPPRRARRAAGPFTTPFSALPGTAMGGTQGSRVSYPHATTMTTATSTARPLESGASSRPVTASRARTAAPAQRRCTHWGRAATTSTTETSTTGPLGSRASCLRCSIALGRPRWKWRRHGRVAGAALEGGGERVWQRDVRCAWGMCVVGGACARGRHLKGERG